MKIKIKNLKQGLLFFACLLLATHNYYTFAAIDTKKDFTVCDETLDSDCDGLISAEETLYGTDANKSDTDDDGYSDGVEVRSGYDPTKPAPGDKIEIQADLKTPTSIESFANDASTTTDSFTKDLQAFVASKEDQPISNSDINDFISQSMSDKMGQAITIDSLPEIDSSRIKILKQSYANIGDTERKAKSLADAMEYFVKFQYLLISNAPGVILTQDDLTAFNENFKNELLSISNPNSNLEYFIDLGNRLELFINQANEIEVPETMLELHIKLLRITKGLSLTFKGFAELNNGDPIERMAAYGKINSYINLYFDFFSSDFQHYFSALEK